MRYLFISLTLTALLSACGLKGPLYLPEKPAVKPTTAAPAPTKAKPVASQPVQQVKDANQP
jgi:predicted small lipoprotein YifL